MSTIIDVENESGVSKSTISRYLQGRNVTEVNRIKIEKAIKKLDYKLNPIASGLKSSKTNTIGVVIPDITDSFFPPIIKEFERCMAEHGYHTILSDYGNDRCREVSQMNLLANKKVDGILLASASVNGDHVELCLEQGLPVILLDRLIPELKCDSITVDNYQASYNAICKCIELGHREIGAVYSGYYTDSERMRGFKKALQDKNIKKNPDYLQKVNLNTESPEVFVKKLVEMKSGPTLIFCSNIYMGIGAIKVRLQDNLKIPDDISVLVFDNVATFPNQEYVSLIKPEFSSISQPLKEIGRNAAQLMLERLELGTDNYKPINIELKTTLKMTSSVADKKN